MDSGRTVEQFHAHTRVSRLHHITYILDWRPIFVTRRVELSSVVPPRSSSRTQRNAFYRISGRVEVAAPAQVVAPSGGWYTTTSPQGDPVSLFGIRYPRSLDTARLVQGDDVAHPSRVGESSMVGQP